MAEPPRFSALLARLPVLGAVALLALNDHVLKGSGLLPGWLTGKLSDFAGLFVAPVLFSALAEAGFARRGRVVHRARSAWLSALAIAVGFALVKLVPSANQLACALLGPTRLDATDLLALPMVFVSATWMTRARPSTEASRWLRSLAFVASALACLATSRPMESRAYPEWTRPKPFIAECARLEIWVSKSGKSGIGVSVAARAVGPRGACQLQITSARFQTGPVSVVVRELPEAMDLTESDSFAYLPFPFDNEALWNQHVAEDRVFLGTLTLSIRANDRQLELEPIHLEQRLEGPHRVPTAPPVPPPPPRPPLVLADPSLSLTPADAGALTLPEGGAP